MARERGGGGTTAPPNQRAAPAAVPVLHESIRNIAANDNRKKMLFDPPNGSNNAEPDGDGGVVIHIPSKASLFAPDTPSDRIERQTRDGSRQAESSMATERQARNMPIRQPSQTAKPPAIFSSPVESSFEGDTAEPEQGYRVGGGNVRSPNAKSDKNEALVRKFQLDAERAKDEAVRTRQGEHKIKLCIMEII